MNEMSTSQPNQMAQSVQVMRDELTSAGFTELRTTDSVDEAFAEKSGTSLLVVNTVCGCAASTARPGIVQALQNGNVPDRTYTVFAGQDREATQHARDLIPSEPPSSPSVFLFKAGELIYAMHRHHIQGHPPEIIRDELVRVFNLHCKGSES